MKDLICNLLRRQKGEIKKILSDAVVTREPAARLKESLKRKLIKAVIGPRRSGKSTLIHQVLTDSAEQYAYINFEDEQLPVEIDFEFLNSCLGEIYPKASILFFDEIQVFPRWEQLLNRLERSGRRAVISGSNSRLLSSELSSSLTGRHELIEVLPFSYAEYLQVDPGKLPDNESFKEYLKFGGFPDVATNRVNAQKYLRELWDSIVLKDIVQRYKVRRVAELQALLSIFRDSISSSLSHRSLERSMQGRASIATIAKFILYGQGAYLTYMLSNFSFKPRERVNSDKKAYIIDNGFYTSLKIGGQEDYGRLLENFIFVSLVRKGYRSNIDLFSYKTKSGKEVDFLALSNGKPHLLLQISWTLANQTTLERELASLHEAAKELDIKTATIVTFLDSAVYKKGGVKIDVVAVSDFISALTG